ncbi:MAG: hypothetical protein KDJ52_22385 [Anaerolineae bacterium]|nr:hypothetical protein [Anaerolineae bacterium]
MSYDDDRKNDYWYYRYHDWDRQDQARKSEQELANLRSRLGVDDRTPPIIDGISGDDETSRQYDRLYDEKQKLLKEIAAVVPDGEKSELYRTTDALRLYDRHTDDHFERLLRLVEELTPPISLFFSAALLLEMDEATFKKFVWFGDSADLQQIKKLRQLRISIIYLRSEWRRYHTT